ncbi:HdeD family acid-resistance protein [Streptomyces sp. NPDC006385]|uniref:HdeD family acid-resistance protein n=1 Tax=Streptomyces sp. NPDC006385 TaxID=3156761 RepID=UPI0033A3B5C7
MTEAPTGSPGGRDYDDRRVHAGHPHGPRTFREPGTRHEPEPPFEGPLYALSRAAWQIVLLTGVASLVLGVLMLARPGASLFASGVLFGLYLLISGAFQLVAAFGTHRTTSLRVLAFVSGALSVLLGLLCFRRPMQSVLLLALWIGIGWLVRGITQTLAAASDTSMPARGWQILLGVVTLVGGIVLIDSPIRSVTVLTLLGGGWLVGVGVVEIVTGIRIRERARQVPHAL